MDEGEERGDGCFDRELLGLRGNQLYRGGRGVLKELLLLELGIDEVLKRVGINLINFTYVERLI